MHGADIGRRVGAAAGGLLQVLGADGAGERDVAPAAPCQFRLEAGGVNRHAPPDRRQFLSAEAQPRLADGRQHGRRPHVVG